jgi:hypothetical protein
MTDETHVPFVAVPPAARAHYIPIEPDLKQSATLAMTSPTPLPPGMVSDMPVLARGGGPTTEDIPVAYTGSNVANGFLNAFLIAYCRHRPLRLRPDDVAQAVLAGAAGLVSAHARASPETLDTTATRPRIEVEVSEYADKSLRRPGVWDGVLDRIQAQCPPEDVPAIGPFSTTTPRPEQLPSWPPSATSFNLA